MVTKLGKSDSFSLFASGGRTMVRNERVHIHKGTRIKDVGYGCCTRYLVVYDDNMHAVQICDGDPNDISEYDLEGWFNSPWATLSEETKPVSEEYGIGHYYYEDNEVISDEVIEKSLQRARNLDELEKKVKERKANEADETRKRLLEEYNYLALASTAERYKEHIVVGNNIRTELRRNFPGVKFKVRYSSFSGGDDYHISWEDGPTTDKVDKIVDKYQDMHPDAYSQGDYWDCKPSIFNNLFGSVGYVLTNRSITDKGRDAVLASFPGLTEDNYKTYRFEDEHAIRAQCEGDNLRDILSAVAHHRDIMSEVKEKPAKPETASSSAARPAKVDGLEIIEYSAKAIAVVGDTKPIAKDLKALGGRFNPRLTCGAGWIFPATKREQIEKLCK